VGPRAVLDTVVRRKIPRPRHESNTRTPIVQPVASPYTDLAITVACFRHFISVVTTLRARREAFSTQLRVQIDSGIRPVSYPVG